MTDKKITTTREEIREIVTEVIENSFSGDKFKNAVENSFGGKKFKDAAENSFGGDKFKDAVMETLVEFNVGKFIPERNTYFEDDIKPSIIKEIQGARDWTDKKVREPEGKIISKINTLTNVLEEKDVINVKEVEMVKRAGVGV